MSVQKVVGVIVACAALAVPVRASALEVTEWLRIAGFVEWEVYAYPVGNEPGKNDGRNEVQFQTQWTIQPGSDVKAFVVPEFRFDTVDESRNAIFLDEAYLDFYTDYFDFRLGKQIISWGRADTIRPTDLWKVRDFTDFLDEEIEGILAAKARGYFGNLTLELIFVPFFQPHNLPVADKRNRFNRLPGSGLIGSGDTNCPGMIPSPPCAPALSGPGPYTVSYESLDFLQPEESIEGAEGAVKLEYTWRGWDFSLSYSYLHDRIPTYIDGIDIFGPGANVVQDDGQDTATFGLRPAYTRNHVIGMDFATTFGGLGLRGEAAYVITDDPDGDDPRIDDPYLQATAGVDYEFTDVIGDQDFSILVQFVMDVEVPEQGIPNIEEGVNLRHFFEYGTLSLFEWQLTEFLSAELRSFINVENADYLIEPRIDWSPYDGLELSLGGTIVGGKNNSESFFDQFEDEDRIEFAARYSF